MKEKTEMVLVETVSMFRIRYVIEVPAGHSDYALDTVTMQEGKEFSQKHLDETIVSHRIIDEKEILELCDNDNSYTISWDKEQKVKTFVTTIEDQQAYTLKG
jgi:hypothetical protein